MQAFATTVKAVLEQKFKGMQVGHQFFGVRMRQQRVHMNESVLVGVRMCVRASKSWRAQIVCVNQHACRITGAIKGWCLQFVCVNQPACTRVCECVSVCECLYVFACVPSQTFA